MNQRGERPVPEMVSLPGGTFRMGSIQKEIPRLRPVRTIAIQPFAIGKYEVTLEEYDAFAAATGRKLPNGTSSFWGSRLC